MTPQELAARLHGREYGKEITKAEAAEAKAAGLVVVFGYSDDNVELRGAIDDEVGATDGATLRITPRGLLPEWPEDGMRSEDEAEAYFERRAAGFKTIEAIWCPPGEGKSWAFRTEIPHATFDVMEDGEVFCTGIVFALADAAPQTPNDADPVALADELNALLADEDIDEDKLEKAAADLLPRVHDFLRNLTPVAQADEPPVCTPDEALAAIRQLAIDTGEQIESVAFDDDGIVVNLRPMGNEKYLEPLQMHLGRPDNGWPQDTRRAIGGVERLAAQFAELRLYAAGTHPDQTGEAEEPANHVDRMRTEFAELSERLERLRVFCETKGGIFDGLPTEEKQRLTEQEHHMAAYLRVLGERIEAAS